MKLVNKNWILECEYCKNSFHHFGYKANKKFCSCDCRKKSATAQSTITCTCEICGKQWQTLRCHFSRTCSRTCGAKINKYSSKDKSKWTKITCELCGKNVERRIKDNNSKHKFCSCDCRKKGAYFWLKDAKPAMSRHKTGMYTSLCGLTFRFDSSYELRRMKELDYVEKDVKSWKRCDFSIPWKNSNGENVNYIPDLLVTYNDESVVIEELKGRLQPNDVLKMKAGIEYAEQRGWKYKLIQYDEKPNFPLVHLGMYENDYGRFMRPTGESVFMHMSLMIAQQSTCLRKKVAAVFTDADLLRVLCFGYNGNVSGGPNQCDSLDEGACGCTHAEINALTKSISSLDGSTCFVTLSPCLACAKVLVNRGVKRVIYYETYRNAAGITLLKQFGVKVEKFENLSEQTYSENSTLVEDLPKINCGCCDLVQSLV